VSVAIRQNQQRDDEIAKLKTVQVGRADYDAQSRIISMYRNEPGARAVWPMSTIDFNAPRVTDVSAHGNHLTRNNAPPFDYAGLVPYITTDGINQYLSRADGGASNWADVKANEGYIAAAKLGLALYIWVMPLALGANQHLIGKWAGAGQKSYRLLLNAANTVSAQISTDGTAVVAATSTATLSLNTWHFIALQYQPSVPRLSVWVDSAFVRNAVGIPATIFDSTAAFTIAASAVPGVYLNANTSISGLYVMYHEDAIIAEMYQQSHAVFGV